jgi:hypothetical protein
MKIKVKKEAAKAVINIHKVTLIYSRLIRKMKELENERMQYREMIIAEAKLQFERLDDSTCNKVDLPNGVSVQRRTQTVAEYDQQAINYDWFSSAMDTGLSESFELKIVPKLLPSEFTKDEKDLLDEINFSLKQNDTYAILV